MTKSYTIHSAASGQDLGTYEGDTPEEAIAAMMSDASCTDEPSSELVAVEA